MFRNNEQAVDCKFILKNKYTLSVPRGARELNLEEKKKLGKKLAKE